MLKPKGKPRGRRYGPEARTRPVSQSRYVTCWTLLVQHAPKRVQPSPQMLAPPDVKHATWICAADTAQRLQMSIPVQDDNFVDARRVP